MNFGESDWERRSGDEHFVEFFDHGLEGILAEDAVGHGERDAFIGVDALPSVEVGVLIVGGEGTVEGDVVLDDVEPMDLSWGESGSLRLRRCPSAIRGSSRR